MHLIKLSAPNVSTAISLYSDLLNAESLNLVKASVNKQYKAAPTGGVDDPLMIAGRLSDGGVGRSVFQGHCARTRRWKDTSEPANL